MSPTRPATPDARTAHYGAFYGLREPPGAGALALVHGNCQAESLRIVLEGAGLATVRMPPVHELVAGDLPHLHRWLERTQVFVTQPVGDGYRGLGLGWAELATRLPARARVARVPVVRFAGLYPAHAIVRPPHDPSLVPPVVAYHDLRVLAEAAARRARTTARHPPLTVAAVRAIAERSREALRAREAAHATVPVCDLFSRPAFAQMRTLNHPGNGVWNAVAGRVRAALGLPEHDGDPGRPLLDGVHAPREAAVIDAFALDAEPRAEWRLDGVTVTVEEVRDAHLRFYARHPDAVDAGLDRHRETLGLLGLA